MLSEEERGDPTQVYKIGIADNRWIPAETEFKNMLHLVAYDICSPKRLRLVAKTCLDYGVRVEKSVFECDLAEATFAAFWDRLNEIIDPDVDALVAYRICRTCVKDILSAGALYRPIQRIAYIF